MMVGDHMQQKASTEFLKNSFYIHILATTFVNDTADGL